MNVLALTGGLAYMLTMEGREMLPSELLRFRDLQR